MAINILEMVRSYLTPDLLQRAGNQLGENESAVSKALSGIVPAIFGGLISRASSGRSGAEQVLGMARDNYQGGFPGNLLSGDLFGHGAGFLQPIFGDKIPGIISAIAAYAGIKNSSADSLLGMAAPLSLGTLGKHAADNNLDADGLAGFLRSQKDNVTSMLPAGLSSVLGLGGLGAGLSAAGTEARQTVHQATSHTTETAERKGTNWIAWILLLAGVIALLWFLTKGCNNKSGETATRDTTTQATTTTATTDTGMTTAPARESMKVQLADGTEINAFRGGIEDQLVACLNDAACKAGKDKWFDFDNINFKTGSASLTDSSAAQVNNIVAILKAYPKAKIKIGGYTDKTGNADANKKLSQQRAEAVMNAIKANGANAVQMVGAEGYGSAFAKVDASASDEERKVDRRISVQLREK